MNLAVVSIIIVVLAMISFALEKIPLALTALLAAGVRTGRDALFITLANKGISPVHPDPVDLLLRDPARDASAFAAAILDFLENDVKRGTITLPIRLVRASTNKTTGGTESSRKAAGDRG